MGAAAIACFVQLYWLGFSLGTTYVAMEEDTYNPNLLDTIKWSVYPDGWEKYSYSKIATHFKCYAHGRDQTKQLLTIDEWNFLRKRWNEVVDNTTTFDDGVPPTEGYSHEVNNTTMFDDRVPQGYSHKYGGGRGGVGPPPYYAKHSKGKGRGLFASRDIKKDELVHDGTKDTVVFPDGKSFRRYAFSLPRRYACELIHWKWTQQLKENGPMKLMTAIDISIFMNSGKGKQINVMPESKTSLRFRAKRDIKKDEEILYNYGYFQTNWRKVGL
ncbi:hypothetical protein ACHAXR_001979 [Thalassiosira sp. AJA248-18]